MKRGVQRIILWLLAFFCLFSWASCKNEGFPEKDSCTVVIEEGENFRAETPVRKVKRGEDVTFKVNVSNGCIITSLNYSDYDLENRETYFNVVLRNVRYSTVVSLYTTSQTVCYHANGGRAKDGQEQARLGYTTGHLLANAEGYDLFSRSGYTQVGWNTKEDGSGESIGFGHRFERAVTDLYAVWEKQNERNDFIFKKENGFASVCSYMGTSEECVIPESYEGLPVKKIECNAFFSSDVKKIVLPPSLVIVETNAFSDSKIEELVFFDGVTKISDDCFFGCNRLKTVNIQAVRPPVYSGSYFDTFPDKMERLISFKDRDKIVLFSGSSARFGYDSRAIDRVFDEYEVVNMGVYAYTNALPQLDMIRTYMKSGDILLHAPEFDTVDTQFCVSSRIDKNLFCMVESNYALLCLLDLREYSGFFDSFLEYQIIRNDMTEKDYSLSAKHYDEDGRETSLLTYNEYGDYIAPRPNAERDEMHRFFRADYTIASFPKEKIDRLNQVYQTFSEKGIEVFFSYAPRNISSLTEESSRENRSALENYLRENIEVPIISEMEDYLFSGVYFFEIDNHLSDEGVKLRTEQVIRDIENALKGRKI